MKTSLEKPSFRPTFRQKRLALLCAVTALAIAASGCGKPGFVPNQLQSAAQAPGTVTVPPKIDLLLVEDDTGSSQPIFSNLSSQVTTFSNQLQTQGWDYHLATIPLTTYRAISQVQASQYDPNWGAQWLLPYPGATASTVESVSSSAFRFPDEYTDFSITPVSPSGQEHAFANLETMLNDSSMTSSGFLRPDAMLAIVLLSTGDDTSGTYPSGNRNYCSGNYARSDGWAGPCDEIGVAVNGSHPSIVCGNSGANPQPYCNNYQSTLAPYESFIKGFKPAGELKFYSVVSAQHQVTGGGCMGTNAFMGQRYMDMVNFVGGENFDICTKPIPDVLNSIASNLSSVQLDLFTSYLFMADEPDPTTIAVWLNPGGDTSRRVEIPQDTSNGWTYAGNVNNVYTTALGSASATPTLNLGSGYAVQLHGTAIIGGSDTATVEFKQAGIQTSD